MSHNLAEIGGRVAMAYQGETPWHALGTRLPEGIHSIEAGLDAASLNWRVGLRSLCLEDGTTVPMKRAVQRESDGEVLSVVSEWYQPIQYQDAFGVFQPAVDEFGLTVEAAGALGKGEKAWMLFKLPATMAPVPGDEVRGYGVAITGHDGRTLYEFRPTPVRVVCQNTLDAAVGHGGRKGRIFGIPHVGNDVAAQVDGAKTLVTNVLAAMQATGETFTKMARTRMTAAEVVAFIETVFPSADNGDVSTPLATKRKTVSELVFAGVGAELAMSETNGEPNPWACYNAVTEYFDHVAPRSAASAKSTRSRNVSALFGASSEVKRLALLQAERLVAA